MLGQKPVLALRDLARGLHLSRRSSTTLACVHAILVLEVSGRAQC
jgi:hypothetical protein